MFSLILRQVMMTKKPYLVFGRLGRAFGPFRMRGRAKVGGDLELHAMLGGEQQQLVVLQHLRIISAMWRTHQNETDQKKGVS